jgi:hypothetical protein
VRPRWRSAVPLPLPWLDRRAGLREAARDRAAACRPRTAGRRRRRQAGAGPRHRRREARRGRRRGRHAAHRVGALEAQLRAASARCTWPRGWRRSTSCSPRAPTPRRARRCRRARRLLARRLAGPAVAAARAGRRLAGAPHRQTLALLDGAAGPPGWRRARRLCRALPVDDGRRHRPGAGGAGLTRPRPWPTCRCPRASALDQPYDRLAALPRALWLPGLVTSVGRPRRACATCGAGRWPPLLAGALPPPDADFGDPRPWPAAPGRAARWACPAAVRGARRWPSRCCARCCGTWTA